MKIERREKQKEQTEKASERAEEVIRVTVRTGASAHDEDQFSVSRRLDLSYAVGEGLARASSNLARFIVAGGWGLPTI